jgi:hypothetical protein
MKDLLESAHLILIQDARQMQTAQKTRNARSIAWVCVIRMQAAVKPARESAFQRLKDARPIQIALRDSTASSCAIRDA